jgi:hypothetical protein
MSGKTKIPIGGLAGMSAENQFGLLSPDKIKHLQAEIELRILQADASIKEGEVRNQEQNREQREKYAEKLFDLMRMSLSFAWLFVFMSGVTLHPLGFYIPAEVLVALLASTTVEVIGLFVLVAKYLFK